VVVVGVFVSVSVTSLNNRNKSMFLIIGIIISFFLSFLLLSKKDKILADKILMTWLFIMGFHLLLFYIVVYAFIARFAWIPNLSIAYFVNKNRQSLFLNQSQ
jgi:hypothetical protein